MSFQRLTGRFSHIFSKRKNQRKLDRAFRPVLEQLETRALLSGNGTDTALAAPGAISVNFGGSNGSSPILMDPTDVAGAYPASHFNNVTDPSGSGLSLVDSAGDPTGAAMTWSSPGVWSAVHDPSYTPGSGDQKLNDGFLYSAGTGGPVNVTVNDIPYAGPYDVYVYVLNDGANRLTTTTANGTSYFLTGPDVNDGRHQNTASDYAYDRATSQDANDPTNGADYVLFVGQTGSSFNFSTAAVNNGALNGFQIVPEATAPTTAPTLAPPSVGTDGVTLNWSDAGPGVNYAVFRSDLGDAPVATLSGLTYVDTTASAGTSYAYTVKAVNGLGSSPASNPGAVSGQDTNRIADGLVHASLDPQTGLLTIAGSTLGPDRGHLGRMFVNLSSPDGQSLQVQWEVRDDIANTDLKGTDNFDLTRVESIDLDFASSAVDIGLYDSADAFVDKIAHVNARQVWGTGLPGTLTVQADSDMTAADDRLALEGHLIAMSGMWNVTLMAGGNARGYTLDAGAFSGRSVLLGGSGDDRMVAARGGSYLSPGWGDDVIVGGDGYDELHFDLYSGNDIVLSDGELSVAGGPQKTLEGAPVEYAAIKAVGEGADVDAGGFSGVADLWAFGAGPHRLLASTGGGAVHGDQSPDTAVIPDTSGDDTFLFTTHDGLPAVQRTTAGSDAVVWYTYANVQTVQFGRHGGNDAVVGTPADGTVVDRSAQLPVPEIVFDGTYRQGMMIGARAVFSDPAIPAQSYYYNWNVDGLVVNGLPANYGGIGQSSFGFTPDGAGDYHVTLEVHDPDGNMRWVSRTVTVENVAPTVGLDGPTSAIEGSTVSLNAWAIDPSVSDQMTLGYTWDVKGPNGFWMHNDSYAPGSAYGWGFLLPDDGTYCVTLTAQDANGGVGVATHTIEVENVPPSVTVFARGTADAGTEYYLDVSTNDPGRDTVQSVTVDWGDGTVGQFDRWTPLHHVYSTGGRTYQIRVSVTDEDGTYATAMPWYDVVVNNVVNPATAGGDLQQQIANVQQPGDPTAATVSFVANSADQVNAFVDAVGGLAVAPDAPVQINLDCGGAVLSDQVLIVPDNVTLELANFTAVGGSPALIVQGGNVVVSHATLTNSTDAPTILVLGGSLTVRNCVIDESDRYTQAAIRVEGGSVDLGTASDPGGNTINLRGAGEFVQNLGTTAVRASGDTFEIDGSVRDGVPETFRASQSIRFDLPSGLTYGDAPVAISATATSGLPVKLTVVSGPATFDPVTGLLTITGAGTVTLRAAQAGSDDYEAAAAEQTVTVAKARAVLGVTNVYDGTYDGQAHAATVTATGVNGEDLGALLTSTYGGTAAPPVAVGSYTLSVTFAGNDNYEASSAATATVVIRRTVITAVGNAIGATEGNPFTSAVASFTDTNPNAKVGDFAVVTIDWGDGSTSAGTVQANASGGFDVIGTHTYRHFGVYMPAVTLRDLAGQSDAFTASGTVNVANAALHTVPPTPIVLSQGKFGGTLVAFTDDNPFALAADYTVTVDWGDGQRSTGYVVADPFKPGQFDVIAYHTYATGKIKSYNATIIVSDGGSDPLVIPLAMALR